jgi:fructoselysine-6-P-deglycase FrlB-like protein
MTSSPPKNIFYEEISQQPAALAATFRFYQSNQPGGALLHKIRNFPRSQRISHITYTGMGSSYFNSLIAFYYLNARGIACDVRDTGEILNYFPPPFNDGYTRDLLIGVSQSGESGEIVQLISKWKGLGWKMDLFWAITNNPDSTLGQAASLVIPTLGGSEQSVTSKTYVTGLLVQYLLARSLAGSEIISPLMKTNFETLITEITPKVQAPQGEYFTLARSIHQFMGEIPVLICIGQGTAMATAMQVALNVKEIAKIPGEAISLNMFRHGPIETITPDFRAIIFVNDKECVQTTNQLIDNICSTWGGGKVLLISNRPESHLPIVAHFTDQVLLIPNPIQDPFMAPIFEMIVLQPYLCYLAEQRGFVPGEFRNTRKITK